MHLRGSITEAMRALMSILGGGGGERYGKGQGLNIVLKRISLLSARACETYKYSLTTAVSIFDLTHCAFS
jgi:hypothetical protein